MTASSGRSLALPCVSMLLLGAAGAGAEEIVIGHEPERCFVAGRKSVIRACFDPAGAIARARVRHRVTPGSRWTEAPMAVDATCHAAILPAPGQDAVGKRLVYSIEAIDHASAAHWSPEFAAVVVAREGDCREGGAAAAAPTTGPRPMPIAIAGGVAAAGAVALAVASGGDPTPPTTSPSGAPRLGAPTPATPPATAADRPIVASALDVPGGEGRITTDGGAMQATRTGTPVAVRARAGANAIEGLLTHAAAPGSWRFDVPGIRPGSLRVAAGTVEVVSGNAVVFRMRGRPGERVAFTFDVEP